MQVTKIPFPDADVSEWTAIRLDTAQGLFIYRQMQAFDLLKLPDYGGGDLDAGQRKEALRNAVNFQKPLAAISIFLGVVALEDFARDFGGRLANQPYLARYFPGLSKLKAKTVERQPQNAFRQLDRDPINFIDPEKINDAFCKAIGIEPIPAIEYPKLRDLALIRHTVAHHGAVVRPIDVARFQHFIVRPNQSLNPTISFVEDTLSYLYALGRTFESNVRYKVFSEVLPTLNTDWHSRPSNDLLTLLEFFDYFGFIDSTTVSVGYSASGSKLQAQQEQEAARIKGELIQRCLDDLRATYAN